jgi:lipopolysaccharide biosynthesis glycosyltransferase
MYPELDKALYLDCDIAVNDSISNLYNTELGDNYVGAIPDQSVKYLSREFQEYVEKRVGVDKYDQYFNAGILVMNLKKLREIDFENKFIDLLSNIKFNVAQDQDYLNVICKGHVAFIDETWNQMPLPVEIERPAKPKLIHYNLSFKPWRLDDVLYEEVFWNYARKTSFIYDILETKRSYTKEMQENTERQTVKLMQLTKEQADDTEENARIAAIIKNILGA